MVAYLVLVLGIALNLLPAGLDSFTVKSPEGKVLSYERQLDSWWKPSEGAETFRSQKGGLTMRAGAMELPFMFSDAFGCKPDIDWNSADTVALSGGKTLTITRKPDGLDVRLSSEKRPNALYEVRWAINPSRKR